MIRHRITSPITPDRTDHWTSQAVCAGRDVNVFYGDAENLDATAHEQVEAAKHLCGTCPVARQCLQEAEQRGEKFGVWGGKNFAARTLDELSPFAANVSTEIEKLYHQGKTDRQIGRQVNLSPSTVGDYRRRLGLPSRYRFGQMVLQ